MDNLKETTDLIIKAVQQRQTVNAETEAYRLFNGFYEGLPGLVLDRYGPTLVVFNHGEPGAFQAVIDEISHWILQNLDDMESVLLKERQHPDERTKNGILMAGKTLPESITEFGVNYALDLQMNQDASFYLDTRNLRRWLFDHMSGLRVLNTFAYTGSLGVAAGAGGAKLVVQSDIKGNFLAIAQQSWTLNALPDQKCEILEGDFFRVTGRMRNKNRLFDAVIIDPPYFSQTNAGKVDLQQETTRLINKVRPLVAHEGWLVVINNALFLSGADFMDELMDLCQSPYLEFDQVIPVPTDITGTTDTIVDPPPVPTEPFNHPTKIAILKVFRKDERK